MLGQLLEFSVNAQPTEATLEAYRSLGFQSLEVSDIPGRPYATMWDGSITLGLQDSEFEAPAPTFVRPDLKMHLRGLRHLGIEFAFAHTADDQFNHAGFLDPNGRLITLVEARTFSPAPRAPASISACGEFVEWSVATHSLDESVAFWDALGIRAVADGDDPYPWVRLEGHGLVVGFYETPKPASGLTYRSSGLGARLQYLLAKGIRVQQGAPIARAGDHAATLILPDKTSIYMVDTDG